MTESLPQQIQREALDPSVPVPDVLRKCIALGAHARFEKLREWASKELRGYEEDDELPSYRLLHAPLFMDYRNGREVGTRQISVGALPEQARASVANGLKFRDPIAEILGHATGDGVDDLKITFESAPLVADFMTSQLSSPFQQVYALYWKISRKALLGVADQVRTVLTEFITELVATMPEGQESPSTQQAESAWQLAVTGKRNKVTVQMPSTSGPGHAIAGADRSSANIGEGKQNDSSTAGRIWAFMSKPGTLVVGTATVLALLVAVAVWAGVKWPPW